MARSCKRNNDCPQGKKCVNGTCSDQSATTTPPQTPAPIPSNRQCTYDGDCGAWGAGAKCIQGACTTPLPAGTPDPTGAIAAANQYYQTSPGSPGGGGGTPTSSDQQTCEVICEPPDPYQMNAGSQPMGTEGYVSSYADPWLQQGTGAGSIAPNSGFDFNTYVQQQQQYEQDWANYQQAMRSGTTPAATPTASTTPAAGTTTTFQDALAQQQQSQNNYGY